MAITEQITCDVCGKVKQAVNHWWLIDDALQLQLFAWSQCGAERKNMKHLCGQECVTKALSAWMALQSEILSTGKRAE